MEIEDYTEQQLQDELKRRADQKQRDEDAQITQTEFDKILIGTVELKVTGPKKALDAFCRSLRKAARSRDSHMTITTPDCAIAGEVAASSVTIRHDYVDIDFAVADVTCRGIVSVDDKRLSH